MLLLLASILSVVITAQCENLTVTDEVFLDFEVQDLDTVGENYTGRVVIALFGDDAPICVTNFVALARGYMAGYKHLTYKNTPVHRIVQDFVLQMGDNTRGDGTGGRSIYGANFNDEEMLLSHRGAGWVSMANSGPDSNNSQFFILLNKARWLDGHHVVFGKVIRGMDVVRTLGDVPINKQTQAPRKKVFIRDSGVNYLQQKYILKGDQLDTEEDL